MGVSIHPRLLLLLLLDLFAFMQRSQGLTCRGCMREKCEPLDTATCSAGTKTDICDCCTVCAKDLNHRCGGPWSMYGKCGDGLQCLLVDETDFNSAGVCVRDNKPIVFPNRSSTDKDEFEAFKDFILVNARRFYSALRNP